MSQAVNDLVEKFRQLPVESRVRILNTLASPTATPTQPGKANKNA